MIALMQALQLKVITGDQYASLMSLYMDVDDFSFGMVVLEKAQVISCTICTHPDGSSKTQAGRL